MKNIITISREYGSGGRLIAKKIAEKIGYRFYDREIILKLAEKTGFAEKFIEENSEYSVNSILNYNLLVRNTNGQSIEDYLWKVQRSLILDIAKEGKCVIVGRCADYILNNRTDVLNIFIYADDNFKIKRVKNIYEEDKNILKTIHEKDKRRKANYNFYTDEEWGMAKNYHLCLDSSYLGIDKCVDMIIDSAKIED